LVWILPLSVSAVSEPSGRLRLRQNPIPRLNFRFDFTTGCRSIFHRFHGFPLSRVRLAGPGFGVGHSLAFSSLTPCEVGDILRYACYPCFVQAETEPPGRQPPAPGSRAVSTGFGSTFLCLRRFPSVAFTSRLPVADSGHSLAFDSLRRVKSATSSGIDATPVSFRPSQSPLAAVLLRQASLSIVAARYRGNFCSVGFGDAFRCFRRFPRRRFHLTVPSH
jgi:hypothetical protein